MAPPPQVAKEEGPGSFGQAPQGFALTVAVGALRLHLLRARPCLARRRSEEDLAPGRVEDPYGICRPVHVTHRQASVAPIGVPFKRPATRLAGDGSTDDP